MSCSVWNCSLQVNQLQGWNGCTCPGFNSRINTCENCESPQLVLRKSTTKDCEVSQYSVFRRPSLNNKKVPLVKKSYVLIINNSHKISFSPICLQYWDRIALQHSKAWSAATHISSNNMQYITGVTGVHLILSYMDYAKVLRSCL